MRITNKPSSIKYSLKKLNTNVTISIKKLVENMVSLAKKCVCFQINSVSFAVLNAKAGKLLYGAFLTFTDKIK